MWRSGCKLNNESLPRLRALGEILMFRRLLLLIIIGNMDDKMVSVYGYDLIFLHFAEFF